MQLSQRYLKFDIKQLLKVAAAAVSGKSTCHCKFATTYFQPDQWLTCYLGIRVLKYHEGLNSKAYLLTMDNGSEIVARLLNPIAGPAYYTTASEVATREFVGTSTA